jgi:hypothetical protein
VLRMSWLTVFTIALGGCATYGNSGQQVRSPDDSQLLQVNVLSGPWPFENRHDASVSVISRRPAMGAPDFKWSKTYVLAEKPDWTMSWRSSDRVEVAFYDCGDVAHSHRSANMSCKRLDSVVVEREGPSAVFNQAIGATHK